MKMRVVCHCGKSFQVDEKHRGKQGICTQCKAKIPLQPAPEPESDDIVPAQLASRAPVDDSDDDEYALSAPSPTPAVFSPAVSSFAPAMSNALVERSHPLPGRNLYEEPAPEKGTWAPATSSATPVWLRHLHWCLAAALLPLILSSFLPKDNTESRFIATLEHLSPEQQQAIEQLEKSEGLGLNDLFELLPDHKIEGALFSRDTWMHWGFALASIAFYMTFLLLLASDKSAEALHLIGIGFFTATCGIVLLLAVQFLASFAASGLRLRGRGIIMLVYLILMLIGWSYSLATQPDSNIWLSLFGFTFGVGLCEEICKALPLLMRYNSPNNQSWRGAFLWGLASGVGFGVSEGITYSQDFYNGISGSDIYLIRFISCVALHAVWSGSVGIAIHQQQHLLQEDMEDYGFLHYLWNVIRLIWLPMLLHGLYDTLLKKDMEPAALAVAVASFGYLAYQIYQLRYDDDVEARAKFVAAYVRGA